MLVQSPIIHTPHKPQPKSCAPLFMAKNPADSVCFASNTTRPLSKQEVKDFQQDVKDIVDIFSELTGISNKPFVCFTNNNEGEESSYDFISNTIDINTEILTQPDKYKIYGLKDSEKILLLSKKSRSPIIIEKLTDKEKTELINELQLDDVIIKPITVPERKKYLIESAIHETEHVHQFDLMRKTEGIGLEKLIETANKGKNISSQVKKIFSKKIVWGKYKHEEGQFKADSKQGQHAYKLFEALKRYSSVQHNEQYTDNLLEREANERADKYRQENYGDWT